MTNRPDDPIDPYESRLARRVDAFAEQAVRPIDATAIASIAAAGARRRTLAGRLFGSTSSSARLGVVLAGAILATGLGVVIGAGGLNGPSATQTATSVGPEATPTSVPGSVDACPPDVLAGEITAWEGAAGHRVATIKVHNTGSTSCALPKVLQPNLVDRAGHVLIVGRPAQVAGSITIPVGAAATTLVDTSNYCGTAPSAPLGISLYVSFDNAIEAYPAAGVQLPIDPPPCNGPSAPAEIQIQELQLTSG